MGYQTDFRGSFNITFKDLEQEEKIANQVNELAYKRHDTSDPKIPGFYLQWIIENKQLQWDCNEKFYNYVEWLEYLLENIFIPNNIMLNGEIEWRGEEWDDM